MLEILKYIFSSFWIFVGIMMLLSITLSIISETIITITKLLTIKNIYKESNKTK